MVFDRNERAIGALPRPVAERNIQDRERERTNVINKDRPLQLLDLPIDVLQAIIREVTHTNDLTSLALVHSVLHSQVIPHIYSRFDIVWPDAGPTVESRVGVDALTYGLATLVMAQDVFGERENQPVTSACSKCGSINFCQHRAAPARPKKIRRGNYFAQFTRKFSLGNGPEDWVKEYLITKESGKMLGTLVALAVGRMRNLESFTWDMPTGVLRDVWLALASLDERDDGQQCRLERVWVRWHDNQDTLVSPPLAGAPTGLPDLPHLIPRHGTPLFHIPPYPRVGFPTFSVLPPLKSLSVLDIDELSYVEELSVLIERSLIRLQELRIGVAHHAQNRLWVKPKEDRTFVPPPLPRAGDQALRRGGLMGIIVSRFCMDFNEAEAETDRYDPAPFRSEVTLSEVAATKEQNGTKERSDHSTADHVMSQLDAMFSAHGMHDQPTYDAQNAASSLVSEIPSPLIAIPPLKPSSPISCDDRQEDKRTLKLEALELERVHLSMPVLLRAFDWSRLRTLTILGCREHENLWRTLRKQFAPPSHSRSPSFSKSLTSSDVCTERRSMSNSDIRLSVAEFKLRITRIHTDAVSAAMLAFLKDTIAPDTLEYLFLQQSPLFKSTVTVDQIYKHAIRRHRLSLRKLLVDSSLRAIDGSPDGNTNWRKWAASRELITCITSGRMHLRELSISIDYKDWHYFLQRLPHASNLRSLHISHIADYVHNRIDPREAALQIVDIAALRPELELCYLGIQGKCFEILEYSDNRKVPHVLSDPVDPILSHHIDDDDISDDHDDRNGNDSDDLNLLTDTEDVDETEDEARPGNKKVALRLREILFYDDKISIFKARHGRL